MSSAADSVPARRSASVDLALFANLVVAGLSAAAGGIHGGAFPEHVRLDWRFGLFFAGSAMFQIVWSVMAVRRLTRSLLWAGAWVNAGLVAVWFVTRTVGPPIGPEPWVPEPIGLVDSITVALEIGLVVLCMLLARPGALAALRGMPVRARHLAGAAVTGAVALVGLAAARTPEHAERLSLPSHERHLVIAGAVIGLWFAARMLLRERDRRLSR
jgi:hypothetical protein